LELNWSTFVLEIINFLVLVWILKRFLYRPVLDVIEQRRKRIEDRLDEARRLHEDAESLKDQYTGRLADWETERRKARDSLARELEEERARRLADLSSSLEQEKEKMRIAEERQYADQRRATERQALQQAAAFSSMLLGQACTVELQSHLVDLLLEELADLSDEQAAGLREQWGEPPDAIEVSSAFPLGPEQRARVESALREMSGLSVPVRFGRDEALLAGLRIVIGAWVLDANVREELRGFAELGHGVR
jgi:F-type H+-transporting ATPase subunit b